MSTLTISPAFSSGRGRTRSARRGAAGHEAVRLTRRGRVAVTLVLLAVVLAAFTLFSSGSVATGEAGAGVPTTTVVVSKGDTLWGIASAVAGPGEIREVIHEIERLNALSSTTLVEGQELAVPLP